MDPATAISALIRVLGHLPPGIWWPICQQSPNELGVAHACNVPAKDMGALLVLSGVLKETASGLCLSKSRFKQLIIHSSGALVAGNI